MLLGLVGKKQSGKDTVFNWLLHLWNDRRIVNRPHRLAFADEVYNEVAKSLGISVAQLRLNKNADPAIRKLLQNHGTEMRAKDSIYWIAKIVTQIDDTKLQVITDCRFRNEADWILSRGGKLVRIRRESSDNSEDTHASETELEGIRELSYVINNDFSQERLKHLVYDMIKTVYPQA
jgi:DNA-directed RNA polymerase subunit H (RpoH/RPB5)